MTRIRVSSPALRTMDGITFASRAEMNRYATLKILERMGRIKDLELQPTYVLQPAYIRDGRKVQPLKYRADFRYLDTRDNRIIVEDVKAKTYQTEVYRIKKKLLLCKYPELNFVEVKV